MSNVVSWNLHTTVNAGKLDDFRALMREMVASTRKEEGALAYEWFLSEDGATCHIYERYADSAAVMVHLASFGANYAERFMGCVQPTGISVYGDPNAEVRGALAGFGAVHYGTFGGFAR